MKHKATHHVDIVNDYGTVKWTDKHEEALLLLADCADTLQMTLPEFVDILILGDRQCPMCKEGLH